MRRVILAVLILCFLIAYGSESSAFWWQRKEESEKVPELEEMSRPVDKSAEKPVQQEKKQDKSTEKETQELSAKAQAARQGLRQLKQDKREELNNTEWEIELNLSSAGGNKPQKDTITFENNQISSAKFSREGFVPTNYTLTINEDGTFVCETMQSSEKAGIAFWRCEFDSGMQKMQGVLSHRIDDETTRDYSFQSISRREIEPSGGE